jgi:hypothetical protein
VVSERDARGDRAAYDGSGYGDFKRDVGDAVG